MTLNNHGWGLREMLFICAGILFCVLFVAVMINNLYDGLTETQKPDTAPKTYVDVEDKLEEAARVFHRRHEEYGNLIISEDLLDEGYITEEDLTVNGDFCSGYILIENNTFSSYISCNNYETEGY